MNAPVWRPATAYVHGIDAPVVVVPGRVAAWLERQVGADLRGRVRGVDAEVDAVLLALATAGAAWRAAAVGSSQASQPEVEPQSRLMSASTVADRLGISSRAVRLAIAAGRLDAELVDGRWLISRESLAHYEAARAAA